MFKLTPRAKNFAILGRLKTIFQAEVYAIDTCAELMDKTAARTEDNKNIFKQSSCTEMV